MRLAGKIGRKLVVVSTLSVVWHDAVSTQLMHINPCYGSVDHMIYLQFYCQPSPAPFPQFVGEGLGSGLGEKKAGNLVKESACGSSLISPRTLTLR